MKTWNIDWKCGILFIVAFAISFILIRQVDGNGTIVTEKGPDGLTVKDFRPDYLIHHVSKNVYFITTFSIEVRREKSITNLLIESFEAFQKKFPDVVVKDIEPVAEAFGYGAVIIGFIVIADTGSNDH